MPLYRAELLAKKPLRYAALIHDLSQVLYLPFDWDDGSYARDRSGYNNHGTIYGAAGVGGKIGMALTFDGVDDYVEVADDPTLDIVDAITVGAWVKLAVSPDGTWRTLVRKDDAYGLEISDGNKFDFHPHTAGSWRFCPSTTTPVKDRWYHVAGTYDKNLPSGNIKIYVNGVKENEVDETRDIDVVVHALRLATTIVGLQRYNGVIDEVRIYNRALSQDEIRMLMYRRLI